MKKKFTQNKVLRMAFELIGVLICLFVIFIQRTNQNELYWSQFVHSLYLTFGRTLFVFGLSFILLPSLLGIKSLVFFMMDTKFFNFVAKVSYCTYLVHMNFIYQGTATVKIELYYDPLTKYTVFVAHSVISIFFGLLFALMVEIPFVKLQKTFMTYLIKSKKKQQKVEVQSAINETIAEMKPKASP